MTPSTEENSDGPQIEIPHLDSGCIGMILTAIILVPIVLVARRSQKLPTRNEISHIPIGMSETNPHDSGPFDHLLEVQEP